jgi:transcriptional regulator with XRE-family HTH domain
MSTFGSRIMGLRTEQKISTKAVARAVGIPQSRYSEMERGVRLPTQTQLERLEKFFGLGVGDLSGPAANDIEATGRLSWN